MHLSVHVVYRLKKSRYTRKPLPRLYKRKGFFWHSFAFKGLFPAPFLMPFAIIFDMDGTLIDTIPLLWESYRRVLAQHGVDLPEEELPIYRGMSWKHIQERWKTLYNVSLSSEHLLDTVIQLENVKLSQGTYVMPGAENFIRFLREKNIPFSIGTSSVRSRAFSKLEKSGLASLFDVVVTADDVHAPKPAPNIFLEAASRMNISPSKCVVIEDSREGVEAAHRAGMKVIGYAPSLLDRVHVERADAIIASFSELNVDFFDRWFSS